VTFLKSFSKFNRTRFSLAATRLACAILVSVFAILALQQESNAATIVVPVGGDLNAAINAAQLGDTIVLQAGATYMGLFTLPNKSGSGYLTIESSRVSELPEGVRVTPAQSSLLARMISHGGGDPVMKTMTGAHHYKFRGIEFAPQNETAAIYGLIDLGSSYSDQNTLAAVPHDLIIDRCYLHGFSGQNIQRGISLNSAETSVLNSWISEIHWDIDTQALAGWNGPGPFHILNNHLEASGENILFGGSDALIPNLVPADIEIRHNHLFKPLSWKVDDPSYAGHHWSVKNILELKNAQRVTIDGNILENNWADGQVGIAIVLTPRNQGGSNPWAIVADVTITNNIVRNSEGGVNLLGNDNYQPSQQARNITIANNLFDQIRREPLLQTNGVNGLTFDHNTAIHQGNIITAYGSATTGFAFTNNIVEHNLYGMVTDGGVPMSTYFPNGVIEKNVIVGEGNGQPLNLAAVGFVDLANSNYRLLSSSPYKGTAASGKDPGADFDTLFAATGGSFTPAPSPTPTPVPAPSATPSPLPQPSPTSASTYKLSGSTFYAPDGSHLSFVYVQLFDLNNQLIAHQQEQQSTYTFVVAAGGSYIIRVNDPEWVTNPKEIDVLNVNADHLDLDFGLCNPNYCTPGPTRTISPNPTPIPTPLPTSGKKSPDSVRTAKGVANTIVDDFQWPTKPYSGATNSDTPVLNTSAVSADLAALAGDIEQAYSDFSNERSLFGNTAVTIETQLMAALYFTRADAALADQSGPSASMKAHLQRIIAHLSVTEDLMRYGVITPATVNLAQLANARADLTIGAVRSGLGPTADGLVSPASLGSLFGSGPLSTETKVADVTADLAPTYELSGVSVSVAGHAVPVVSVSPSRVMFFVPADLPVGTSEVLVVTQDGYVSLGSLAIMPNVTRLMTRADDETGPALAFNAARQTMAEWNIVSANNLGPDKRTRLSVFATGLSGSAANTDTSNDVAFAGKVIANFAESVIVEAHTANGNVYRLPVEFAGSAGTMPGLDQISVLLIPELQGAGKIDLTLIVNGQRSNAPTIVVQ
jgi:uncharacterized protein (TIGR03437 family)